MVIDEAHRLKNSATQVRSSLKDLDVDFTVLLTGAVSFFSIVCNLTFFYVFLFLQFIDLILYCPFIKPWASNTLH